jgi:hypothetical protein
MYDIAAGTCVERRAEEVGVVPQVELGVGEAAGEDERQRQHEHDQQERHQRDDQQTPPVGQARGAPPAPRRLSGDGDRRGRTLLGDGHRHLAAHSFSRAVTAS